MMTLSHLSDDELVDLAAKQDSERQKQLDRIENGIKFLINRICFHRNPWDLRDVPAPNSRQDELITKTIDKIINGKLT